MQVGDTVGRAEIVEVDNDGNAVRVKVPVPGNEPQILTLSYAGTRAILELLFPAIP